MPNEKGIVKRRDFIFSWPFLLAYLSLLFTGSGNQFFVLYPLNLLEFGKNEAQIGFLMGASAIGAFILRPVTGNLLDRYGRCRFIILGAFASGVIMLLYNLPYTSDMFITIIRIIHGISYATFFASLFTWVADYSPEGRLAEGIGIIGSAGLISMSSGTYFGELVLRLFHGNFKILYCAAALFTFIGCLCAAFLKESKAPSTSPGSGFFGLLRRSELISAILGAIIFGIAIGVITNFIASFIKASHSATTLSTFFTCYTIAAISVRIFSGRGADRLGRSAMIIPGLLILGTGHIALVLPGFQNLSSFIGFYLGAGHGLIYPALNAMMLERVGEKDRGAGSALFNASIDTGFFGGSSLFGLVAKMTDFSTMYKYSGASLLAGMLLFLLCDRQPGRKSHQT